MAGDLVTGDWQAEFRGLALGDGSPYDLVAVSGLLDLPEVRAADRALLRRHGLLPGDDFLGGRAVAVTLEVQEDDPAAFGRALDDLLAAFRVGPSEEPFVFQFPGVAGGGRRLLHARTRKRSAPLDLSFLYGTARVEVELFATDPRIYDATERTSASTLPSAGGGWNFDLTFPATFGAVSQGGAIVAMNDGTFPSPPVFRIDGPVVNPRMENLATGEVLDLFIELAAGEFLVLDTEARTVLLGGTASRYSRLSATSTWWDLEPGRNDVTFRASTPSSASLSMTWRSAWA
jgi:hypothetical protein